MLRLLQQVVNIDRELRNCAEQIKQLKAFIKEKREAQNGQVLKNYSESKQPERSEKGLKARMILKGHFGKVYGIDWHTDNTHLLSVSQDGKLIIWDTSTAKRRGAVSLWTSHTMTCAFSPSGNLTASGGLDNICTLTDISEMYKPESKSIFKKNEWREKSKTICELRGHEGYLSCCKFVDENTIITTSGDSTAIHWDIERKCILNIFLGHRNDVMSVCVDRSSHLFVTASTDATAKVWDYRIPKRYVLDFDGYHTNDINCAEFFPNKRSFVTGSDDSSCRLFDLRSYQQLAIYQKEMQHSIWSVDVSVSGYSLFAAYDTGNVVFAWNTINAEVDYSLQHPQRPSRLKLPQNGTVVATACWDHIVRIWS
ncbi:G protein b-subunit [Reticulomyxa filosa]|uniref:G protein b-subunit n=1 Tax=Reticulomyxa filosa TaxID=46433 RepID=X6MJV2_RETFI|nr:G protein b-subunit [Reticulomyxa filosa]|eukprot:ETO13906.1 G protein b-subunit [Reticulomyxa filosa]